MVVLIQATYADPIRGGGAGQVGTSDEDQSHIALRALCHVPGFPTLAVRGANHDLDFGVRVYGC